MEQKKKYSFYEGGDVENKIAGKNVADPLGVLMVLTPKLWEVTYNKAPTTGLISAPYLGILLYLVLTKTR